MVNAVSSNNAAANTNSATSASALGATSGADQADRFLKLLVAQLQNQDPLNPMDNAQVTSQMAQINTVTGIEKLNTTVGSLSGQFMQMQAVQGAALVGRTALHEGNATTVVDGKVTAGFELASAADSVQVEVMNASGRVLDTVQLGALGTGRQGFEWNAGSLADGDAVSFKVTAKSGASAVSSTPLVMDVVGAVSTDAKGLVLELTNGKTVSYQDVKALS
jgi:flagellar basal-body rod modification protein FlgD